MSQQPFHEENVGFQGPVGRLAGTLAIPDARPSRGSILILAGSGGSARDGNVPQLRVGIYRDLAHALSGHGFVTLRYDKRGIGESETDKSALGFWDLVDDAASAVEFLRQRSPADPIILLGHSEGCLIGAALNARQSIDGLIWLGGPCESLHATLTRQQERAAEDLEAMRGITGLIVRALRLPATQRRKSRALMEKIMSSDDDWVKTGGAKLDAKWIREQCLYDVRRDLPLVQCPALAITGSKDIQVLPGHAEQMAKTVSGPSEWHVIPDMTHILRRTDEPLSMLTVIKLYKQQAEQPIDAELLDRLKAWLDEHYPQTSQPAELPSLTR